MVPLSLLWMFIRWAVPTILVVWTFASLLTFWAWIPMLILYPTCDNPTLTQDDFYTALGLGAPCIVFFFYLVFTMSLKDKPKYV